jgi:hypothetical protein
MAVNFQKRKLSECSADSSLRYDYKFMNALSPLTEAFYSYESLFEIVEPSKPDIDDLENFQYAEIGSVSKNGEVSPVSLSFSDRNEANESLFRKIEKGDIFLPDKGDILISKIRPYLNKIILIEDEKTYYTKAFIQIRPRINSLLLYCTLRTIFFKNLNSVSRQGKGYPTLKEEDLKSVRFPKAMIDKLKSQEETVLSNVQALFSEIRTLKRSKIQDIDIINQVFGDEFCFDWSEFESLKSQKRFNVRLTDFSGNTDCRFGCRFHNKAGQFVYEFLCSKTDKRIKDFISEPIVLGKSVSPNDYDDEGEFYYIAMSDIKTWAFDPEDCKKVSESYALANLNKTVKKNDILLARSGEGTIGKVALIEDDDIQAVFADFTQRIRLINYNPRLAYYYFRSDFFQYLIYTHKKGLGNNTNIFPSQIKEFPIPDWSEEKQTKTAEKIKHQIDAQRNIDKEIEKNMAAINRIIEESI